MPHGENKAKGHHAYRGITHTCGKRIPKSTRRIHRGYAESLERAACNAIAVVRIAGRLPMSGVETQPMAPKQAQRIEPRRARIAVIWDGEREARRAFLEEGKTEFDQGALRSPASGAVQFSVTRGQFVSVFLPTPIAQLTIDAASPEKDCGAKVGSVGPYRHRGGGEFQACPRCAIAIAVQTVTATRAPQSGAR
jgi:multidrug efflux pump subunit AcrA (membrane-fusion protein)